MTSKVPCLFGHHSWEQLHKPTNHLLGVYICTACRAVSIADFQNMPRNYTFTFVKETPNFYYVCSPREDVIFEVSKSDTNLCFRGLNEEERNELGM